jgi:hypothetical protein
VGYGIVTSTAVMAKDFEVAGEKLIDICKKDKSSFKEPDLFHHQDDEELAEYLVGVDWKTSLPVESAQTFKGIFANQNIVCKLRNPATLEFLLSRFNVTEDE